MALRTRARRRQSLPMTGPSRPPDSHPADIHASLELFEGLSRRQLKRLRRELTVTPISAGTVIGRQGDVGREFVVVLEGRVVVIHDDVPLAVLETGCHFGELPMLRSAHAPYQRASFHALGPAWIAVANRREFRTILDLFPLVADRVVELAEARLVFIDQLDAERDEARETPPGLLGLAEQEQMHRQYPVRRTDAQLVSPRRTTSGSERCRAGT